MYNAAPWRHNASQRYVFSGFFDYQVLVNKSPGNTESLCANIARICTSSVISSKALPSSNLVTHSPNLKRRTRHLQHSDGHVLCIGDWASLRFPVCFSYFSRSSAHFITRRPTQPSHKDSHSRCVAFLNNSSRPTRNLEARQWSIGNTLFSTPTLWLACLPNVQHTSSNCPKS